MKNDYAYYYYYYFTVITEHLNKINLKFQMKVQNIFQLTGHTDGLQGIKVNVFDKNLKIKIIKIKLKTLHIL